MSEYIDASVIVKWFKEGEEFRRESLKLRERVINFDTEFVMSYYGLLEIVRALVKANFPREIIDDTFQSINDLYNVGALKSVSIDEVLYLAKEIEIEVNLYASDALHVASAINHNCDILWSADKHHTKDKTKNFLNKFNIKAKHISDV